MVTKQLQTLQAKTTLDRLASDKLSSLFVTCTSGKGKSFIKLPPGPLVVKLWLER